ncbi:hypothetical protein VC35_16355 [Pseudomonas fluorescens]|jgi:hypothetical protein|uniref:Uncharacterized protein n=1 Tax=Pseudomonas fluorescens TaxID=294 RepID=A0A0F4TK33_PSEFL|nr:hypothetical protein VC35_16355 [Pseudomonas fluorescens]
MQRQKKPALMAGFLWAGFDGVGFVDSLVGHFPVIDEYILSFAAVATTLKAISVFLQKYEFSIKFHPALVFFHLRNYRFATILKFC